MTLLKFFFWLSFLTLLYSYIGYGMLMHLIVLIRKRFTKSRPNNQTAGDDWPEVTIVISAYNEEDFIEKKIENSFQLDYPAELLKIICITDGSNDRTSEIVSKHPGIQLMHQALRQGKSAAMNRAIREVGTEIVIFSDANTLLNPGAIRAIVRHYEDPRVGGVAGEKKILTSDDANVAGAGEGFYWKYESLIRNCILL
jgi:cellulose synthase/poly-beta-1,6-N-acetylglucosamine synthase-like glycosyltransferase